MPIKGDGIESGAFCFIKFFSALEGNIAAGNLQSLVFADIRVAQQGDGSRLAICRGEGILEGDITMDGTILIADGGYQRRAAVFTDCLLYTSPSPRD